MILGDSAILCVQQGIYYFAVNYLLYPRANIHDGYNGLVVVTSLLAR